MGKIIELKNITYRYDNRKTDGVTGISFSINKSQSVCLIGPSGSGKSTTAKLVADKLCPQSGSIKFFDNSKVSYVPQDYKLPNDKTVFDYLMSCLSHLEDDEQKETIIRSNLLLLNISNETHSLLNNISGGQKQRVIIASALIQNPDLIVLDEPFGTLDEKLRLELMEELFSIFKDQSIACLWVTHQTVEALSFSDKVILLNFGVIEQISSPYDIYNCPNNMFCADFFGKNNLLPSKLISISENDLLINIFDKEILIPKPQKFNAAVGQDILLVIRPENIVIKADGEYSAAVTKVFFQGARSLLEVELKNGYRFWLVSSQSSHYKNKEQLNFSIDYTKIYCLDEI
jgi:ABC-type Fe3+/spermidine/putrescine transport system ATPase subunit